MVLKATTILLCNVRDKIKEECMTNFTDELCRSIAAKVDGSIPIPTMEMMRVEAAVREGRAYIDPDGYLVALKGQP